MTVQYKRFCLVVCLFINLGLASCKTCSNHEKTDRARIAIILDDAGGNTNNMDLLKNLSVPVTVAIIPNAKHANAFAELCRTQPIEMIAHIPMEAMNPGKSQPLIHTEMDPIILQQHLTAALDSLVPISGINNHKGSKATADLPIMREVVKVLKSRNMFIIDSRTTRQSVIPQVAQEEGVPYLCNDHFLDGRQDVECVQQRLKELAEVARTRGYAVGIGHVTRRPILEALQIFASNHPDLEWVNVSTLLKETRK